MTDDEALIPVANYLDEPRFEGALTQWHRRLNEKLGRPGDDPLG